jgi:two-component system NtrC family response regulator
MSWRVLLLDDEANLLKVLEEKLKREGFEVSAYSDPRTAIDQIELSEVDVVLTDLTMPGSSGLEVLDYCRERRPDLPVVIMTAFGSVEKAVQAMRRGAFDFITKPFDSSALVDLLRKAAGVLEAQKSEPRASVAGDPWAVARIAEAGSPMLEVLGRVDQLAHVNAPVLFLGEQGTGREAIARELHRRSPRAAGPFVKLHCGALSQALLDAELFGVEESSDGLGAGAPSRPGKLELASGGVLFLEGIIELPAGTQVRLLKFLQEGTFEREGGLRARTADVRLVVASEESLQKKGLRFRAELASTLKALTIKVPALRERRADIRKLAVFFLRQATIRTNRIVQGMSEDLLRALEVQEWPGNLKQLESQIESMVLLSNGPELGLAQLAGLEQGTSVSFKDQVRLHTQQLERTLIEAELARQDGNVSRTAEALGLSRKGLQLKLKELGIR